MHDPNAPKNPAFYHPAMISSKGAEELVNWVNEIAIARSTTLAFNQRVSDKWLKNDGK